MFGFHGFDEFVGVLKFLIFWSFVLALILGLAVGPRYIRSRDRQRIGLETLNQCVVACNFADPVAEIAKPIHEQVQPKPPGTGQVIGDGLGQIDEPRQLAVRSRPRGKTETASDQRGARARVRQVHALAWDH